MSAYLDYQAAKPVDPRVFDAMKPYFIEEFGNPSSLHLYGYNATNKLEESRQTIAEFINAPSPDNIIFTSGATESNNLAIIGGALRNKRKGNHIIISEIEHISILNIGKYLEREGFKVSRLSVDQYGRINLNKLERLINDKTILISISTASNEIGTLQPIEEIAEIAQKNKVWFHSDAVATQSSVPIDVQKVPFDLLTLSSNEIYGPRGIGALYLKKGVRVNPIIIGGGQEKGMRSGSENMPGIVGFAKAAEIMKAEINTEAARLKKLRDKLIEGILKIPKSYLNGHPEERTSHNANFRFDYIEGESLLLALKDENVEVATGSACSSKTLEPSHTLISCGLLHEEAHGSLLLTLGRFSEEKDVDKIIEVLPEVVRKLRVLSPLTPPKFLEQIKKEVN
ncbi:MAG: cysteine desulfurase [Promethearchaeota archaeon]|nr:MAG: cysteine desulfurase [Candidatus Lokiarchaeota archaeon]